MAEWNHIDDRYSNILVSVRRTTYKLVMDFIHLCSLSSMYLQQVGTMAKMAVALPLPFKYTFTHRKIRLGYGLQC